MPLPPAARPPCRASPAAPWTQFGPNYERVYVYEGLYEVVGARREPGQDGPLVCRWGCVRQAPGLQAAPGGAGFDADAAWAPAWLCLR
jgi:hypothetical protein